MQQPENPFDGKAIAFDYHYGIWAHQEDAQTWCDAVNKYYGSDSCQFGVEFHTKECEHTPLGTGYYVVARNEYGERWTGAPWESGHGNACDDEYATHGDC